MSFESGISPEEYRRVMGHFLTGVTVVTAIDDGQLKGFTANAFSALSIDPPLLLVCPSYRSSTYRSLQSAGRFSVHLLAQGQEDLARTFASKEKDKADRYRWRISERGCPILDDTMGTIECRWFREYEGGDHAIVLGAVEAMSLRSDLKPLVYFRGDLFGLADLAQIATS
jgi:flavin reductase (DIM6/NTAB) family NADH-FMN oxidoreductase RutF